MSETSSITTGESTPARPSRRFRLSLPRTVSAWMGSVFLLVIAVLVFVVPLLPIYDPSTQDVRDRLLGVNEDAAHPLGTDQLGRDVLSRLAVAGSVVLRLSAGAVLLALVIGTVIGLLAGYFRGWLDRVVRALADMQLAIPRILLLIAAVAVFPRSLWLLIVLLGVSSWVPYAMVVRSSALSLRESEFVLAARAAGGSHARLMGRHVLPHLYSNIVILASIDLGVIVMLEATLSFLGLGVSPPSTSWGLMVYEAQTYMSIAPHLVVLPGLCVFLLVAGINFVSQGMTDEARE